jgi:uncharacterized protein (TIGR01370 family)
MIGAWFARRELIGLGLAALLVQPNAAAAETIPLAWAVDYGAHTDPVLARSYGLLVLEPDHPRDIASLRGPGAKMLGYISLGEVERSRAFAKPLEKAGALRAANANWPDARYVDLRHAAWSSLVLERLVPEILAKGFDGIFIDTLDNAEAMERGDPASCAGMVTAAAGLVKAIRARFPKCTIMLNRGYALLPQVASLIDIVLGEAMASRWNFSARRYEMVPPEDWDWQANRLRAAKAVNPSLIAATLDYWDPADPVTIAGLYARERAAQFLPYVSTLALDRLIPEPKS